MFPLGSAGRLYPPTAAHGRLAHDNKMSGAYWLNAAVTSLVHASPVHTAGFVRWLGSISDPHTARAHHELREADTPVFRAPRFKATRRPAGREYRVLDITFALKRCSRDPTTGRTEPRKSREVQKMTRGKDG